MENECAQILSEWLGIKEATKDIAIYTIWIFGIFYGFWMMTLPIGWCIKKVKYHRRQRYG